MVCRANGKLLEQLPGYMSATAAVPLSISAGQRAALGMLARSQSAPHRQAWRAQALSATR